MCFSRRFEHFTVPTRGYDSKLRDIYCLAPYFSDLNTISSGKVYYKAYDYIFDDEYEEAINVSIIVRNLVSTAYKVYDFTPLFIAKATWVEVPHYLNDVNGVNIQL